jgi:hypothetical protein
VAEALGHRGDGDSCREHLGGHEVAEIVQPEVRQARGTPGGDEPLRQSVGQPRLPAVRTRAEHERACRQLRADLPGSPRRQVSVRRQHAERLGVEFDPVGAVGLGGAELGSVWPLDQRASEGDRGSLNIDVAPPQGEQLTPTGTGRDREPQVAEEWRVLAPRPLEQDGDLLRGRRADLGRCHSRRRRVRSRVQPDPVPAEGLSERPMEHSMDPGHGSWGEGRSSRRCPQEMRVEVIDIRGGQLGQVEVAEVRLQVALDDRPRVAHDGGGPPGRCRLEPVVEQVSQCAGPDPCPVASMTRSSSWCLANAGSRGRSC